jgi:hypothetical protein
MALINSFVKGSYERAHDGAVDPTLSIAEWQGPTCLFKQGDVLGRQKMATETLFLAVGINEHHMLKYT